MGYDFEISGYFRIKEKMKEYPWPCMANPNRTITLSDRDILTKQGNGKYLRHTGVGCMNIEIPTEDLIEVDYTAKLRMV